MRWIGLRSLLGSGGERRRDCEMSGVSTNAIEPVRPWTGRPVCRKAARLRRCGSVESAGGGGRSSIARYDALAGAWTAEITGSNTQPGIYGVLYTCLATPSPVLRTSCSGLHSCMWVSRAHTPVHSSCFPAHTHLHSRSSCTRNVLHALRV
eukprot:360643-Chlamydomonas_euryale.AAC.9